MLDVTKEDVILRTTLTIDNDVLRAVKQLAKAEGISIGEALSQVARRGLQVEGHTRTRNAVVLLPVREGAIGSTLEEVNTLRDEPS